MGSAVVSPVIVLWQGVQRSSVSGRKRGKAEALMFVCLGASG